MSVDVTAPGHVAHESTLKAEQLPSCGALPSSRAAVHRPVV